MKENLELRFKISQAYEEANKTFLDRYTDNGIYEYNEWNDANIIKMLENIEENCISTILEDFDNEDEVNSFVHSNFYKELIDSLKNKGINNVIIEVKGGTMPGSAEGFWYERIETRLISIIDIDNGNDTIKIFEDFAGKGITLDDMYKFLNKIDLVDKTFNS